MSFDPVDTKLSVVLPTHNEQKNPYIPNILALYKSRPSLELICVDSSKNTYVKELCHNVPNAKYLYTKVNTRAERLNEGIAASQAKLILLNHPRSLLDGSAIDFLLKSANEVFWGGFKHQFDQEHWLLKFTSWYSNFRAQTKHILYLDHCIFFHKSLLTKPLPAVDIFEDTELSYILSPHGPPCLPTYTSTTSAVRFQKNGIYKQILMNQALKGAYHMGLSAKFMNKVYERRAPLNSEYK